MGTRSLGVMAVPTQSTLKTLNSVLLPWERRMPNKTLKQRTPKSPPLVTILHCTCQLAFYYFVHYRQRGFVPSQDIFVSCGGKDTASMAKGENWRYVTAYFVPCHIASMVLNVSLQGYMGFFLEPEWGSLAVFVIIWTSVYGGLAGSCHSGTGNPTTAGTAAVAGLASAYFVDLLSNWQTYKKFVWRRYALFWMMIVGLTFSTTVLDFNDSVTAGYGMMFGLFIAAVVVPSESEQAWLTLTRGVFLMMAAIVLFVMDPC